jgi:2-iminobutanoate/2-iminopropanoate deaminase
MNREIVVTNHAPAAIGPYSQAIRFSGGMVYTAGQIPLDPGSGQIVGVTAAEQAEQVLKNVSAILEAAGSSLPRAVKVTMFLKNMNDFAAVNEVYSRYFPHDPPARSAVEVARLPKDVLVEIECLALVP